jgi:hypothetical protein
MPEQEHSIYWWPPMWLKHPFLVQKTIPLDAPILGMSHLVLSYFDGKSLFPLGFSIHISNVQSLLL